MEKILYIGVLLVLFYIFVNALLSKEIMQWEPSAKMRIILMVVVWLVPFVGAFFAYKSLGLDWFQRKKLSETNAQSNMSGALLEIDSIFNPGQRHVVEQKQKEQVQREESVAELKNKKNSN